MRVEAQVGPQQAPDGQPSPLRSGSQGELIIGAAHAPYTEATRRGKLFLGVTPAAGVTVPIYTNVVSQFLLYNPPGSGVLAVIRKVYLGYVDTTNVAGHVCYGYRVNISADATAPGTVTVITPIQTVIGAPAGAARCRIWSPATLVTAPAYLRPMGVSQVVQAATATNAPYTQVDDVDGEIAVAPDAAFAVAANVAAGPGKCVIAVSFEEVPLLTT